MRTFILDFDTGACLEYANGLKRNAVMTEGCIFIDASDDAVDIEQARKTALKWFNDYVDKLSDELLSKYSKSERDTFYKKQRQAASFLSGDSSDCALLRAECAAIGFELNANHCQKILAKSAASDQLWGFAFGLRQSLDIALQQCSALSQIQLAYDSKIAMIDAALVNNPAQAVIAL